MNDSSPRRRGQWKAVLSRRLSPIVVGAVFALVVADVHENFALLEGAVAWGVTLAAVVGLAGARRSLAWPGRSIATVLSVGALVAIALGTLGALERTGDAGRGLEDTETADLVSRATMRFAALCRSAREAARSLATTSAVAMAVEGSDVQDYVGRAFEALGDARLPQAHPRGDPGATLFDALERPVAWSGENVSLEEVLVEDEGVPDSELFVFEQGVYTYLVAIEPLLSRRGFVSVEIPLAADRRLENRYLDDYDAISWWLGRSAESEFVELGDDNASLVEEIRAKGETYRAESAAGLRLYFTLRSDEGRLLGLSSIAGESALVSQREARGHYTLVAAVSLVASVLVAVVLGFRGFSTVLMPLAILWGARLVISFTELPLSLGLDVDNPAHYASSLFFGLARSPVDFLLTAATLLVSVFLFGRGIGTRKTPFRSAFPFTVLFTVAAVAVLVATNEVILDAWLNSSVALSTMSIFPFDAPRLVLQLGLVTLFVAAVVAATLLQSLTPVRSTSWVLAIDASIVAIAYVAARHLSLGEHVLLAVPPFMVARVLFLSRNPIEKRWSRAGLYDRLITIGVAGVATVVSFYPAIARFEDRTVRDFVETTVAPIVHQHGGSRLYAIAETARAIDQMLEDDRVDDLGRDDAAFRIWARTDLVASSLSSSIEIVDESADVVSRFALTFPPPAETTKPPAPSEWILEEETMATDPNHPGVLLARRSVAGPDGARWEIRVRVAADWRNLPFISTNNPYLYLFRTAGVDAPPRFPYRELSLFVLEPSGTAVFQSSGEMLQPDQEILEAARREPLWWTFPRSERQHEAYVFSDQTHTFVLTYATKGMLTYAAELAAWALLASGLMLVALAVAVVAGATGTGRGVSPRDLWAGIGTSFHGKLYVSFVLIALIPIASLAFLIRGIFIQQLERDVEQEGRSRAQVVERFVTDFVRDRHEQVGEQEPGETAVTDEILEWVGSLTGVDVDLYFGGELVATSKPELFGSGLLRSRVAATAFRDIVLERLPHSIHRESVGSFEYIVVSVPITFRPEPEPGILSIPLASQKSEIDLRVSTVNQTLLLAALGFSLAAAGLAYSLARRIAGPINALTHATHRVAEGDLDVALQTPSEDEIGDLVRSFTQMAADLKRQRSDLERTKKLEAWAEMARQVAHEVKNPLTPIQLAAEHLLRVHKDPNVDFEKVLDDCTETILQQVKTLRQISMEFSTFASPGPMKTDRTNIEELVRETMAPYVQAPPEGVTVRLEIADDLPELQADGRLLKRTLLNLVENALHALNGKGTIAVDVLRRIDNGTGYVELSVADTGVGIEPDVQTRIFEPYFSTRAAGTGLGLAIAKKVVEDHGGSIQLQSEPGKGTTVRLRLPVG